MDNTINQAVEATITFNPTINKYECEINGKQIGTSVHYDYFEFHYRRGDNAQLNKVTVSQFVHIELDGNKKIVQAVRKVPRKVGVTVQKVIIAPPEVVQATVVEAVSPTKEALCPHCGSNKFKKDGKDKNDVQKYRCNAIACKKGFKL